MIFEWQTPAGAGDMLKSEYDSDGNGIVDNAEKVKAVLQWGTNVPANAKGTDTGLYSPPLPMMLQVITQTHPLDLSQMQKKLAWNDKVDNSRVLTDVPAEC